MHSSTFKQKLAAIWSTKSEGLKINMYLSAYMLSIIEVMGLHRDMLKELMKIIGGRFLIILSPNDVRLFPANGKVGNQNTQLL